MVTIDNNNNGTTVYGVQVYSTPVEINLSTQEGAATAAYLEGEDMLGVCFFQPYFTINLTSSAYVNGVLYGTGVYSIPGFIIQGGNGPQTALIIQTQQQDANSGGGSATTNCQVITCTPSFIDLSTSPLQSYWILNYTNSLTDSSTVAIYQTAIWAAPEVD